MKWLKELFSKTKEPKTLASTRMQGAVQGSLLDVKRARRSGLEPIKPFLPYITVACLALMAADLTAVYLRSLMIPSAAPATRRRNPESPPYKPLTDYNDILARNIFNSDGFIPELEVAENSGENVNSGIAKESALPLNLV